MITEDPKRLKDYRQAVHDAYRKGKLNLVGIYGIRESGVTSMKRLEEFKRGADLILAALDLKEVYAVFIDEENVVWGGGLEALNGAYDHIKAHYPHLPVYQWLSAPEVPHPKLKADGWVYDLYTVRKNQFRKHVMKYLVTGKPLVMCINASPDIATFETPLIGFESSQDQVDVCREFGVPMFFYCVDPIDGSPAKWLYSDEPDIAKWRGWCFQVIEQAHRTDASQLPYPSANFSPGQPIEAAGDAQNRFVYHETFDGLQFIDDATIHGFLNLRWDGEKEVLYVPAPRDKAVTVQLIYHFFSMFDLYDASASLAGEVDSQNGSWISLELSTDGRTWQQLVKQPVSKGAQGTKAKMGTGARHPMLVPVSLTAPQEIGAALNPGKNLWVRVTMHAPPSKAQQPACLLKELTVSAKVLPPRRREILLKLRPDQRNRFYYRDDFDCQRYLHLAEIENSEMLLWRRGEIWTHGVEGRGNIVVLRQKFVSAHPLKNIKVRMKSLAHERNLGAHNELAVSLDGKQKLRQETTAGKEGQAYCYSGVLEIDLSQDERFTGVREFWVHLEMHSMSGVKTGRSNSIDWFEVEAEKQICGRRP
jgi:hypothetical protein